MAYGSMKGYSGAKSSGPGASAGKGRNVSGASVKYSTGTKVTFDRSGDPMSKTKPMSNGGSDAGKIPRRSW